MSKLHVCVNLRSVNLASVSTCQVLMGLVVNLTCVCVQPKVCQLYVCVNLRCINVLVGLGVNLMCVSTQGVST